jgi:hypothetical protein
MDERVRHAGGERRSIRVHQRPNFRQPVLPAEGELNSTVQSLSARELRRVRAEALPKIKGGLRALYRMLELPGANLLKDGPRRARHRHPHRLRLHRDFFAQIAARTKRVE